MKFKTAVLLLALPSALAAQTTPAPAASDQTVQPPPPEQPVPVTTVSQTGTGEQAVKLDPFEVQTSQDTSYGALNSNSITRFSTELDKTPISADIFTQSFMDDVGATSVTAMLTQYGAGMGMVEATPSSDALLNQPGDRVVFGDRFAPPFLGVRGLSAGYILRDGFTSAPTQTDSTDAFDIQEVEVLRGPEGLLYGAGGAGGTIVATTKQAEFDDTSAREQFRIDQYGSKRNIIDLNEGNDWVALKFSFLKDDTDYRRVVLSTDTAGYYTQVAFRLPLNTIVRVEGEYSDSTSILPDDTETVNFGSTANDPRSGDSLAYLLATDQTGAINPSTGQPYSKFGAIDNGNLSWANYASYASGTNQDIFQNYTLEATADTVWNSWLSSNVGCFFNRSTDRSNSNLSALSAPLENGNPFDQWAVSNDLADVTQQQLYKEARASLLIKKDFLSGIARTQTGLGFDHTWRGYGAIDDGYFLSDSNGNITYNPSTTTNLGRSPIAAQWYPVPTGPLSSNPFPVLGTVPYLAQNGQYYGRTELNPRSPMWIVPNGIPGANALGDASLYSLNTLATVNQPGGLTGIAGNPGVSGTNFGGYGQQVKDNGGYIANYTSWWDDAFTTLVGYRITETSKQIPNGSINVDSQYNHPSYYRDPSYNYGVDARILSWLRAYVSLSSTFNNGYGQDDPFGDPPPTTHSTGQEIGLKFTPLDSRISGSFAYYQAHDYNEGLNYGGNLINEVNPTGLNGVYAGDAGRNSFAFVNDKSDGLELIMNANPTPNWRLRFSATASNGTVLSTVRMPIVYNDQFYTDGKGDVTYADGSPFLVPVTPGSSISGLSTQTNPATILAAGPTEQLTTAMIGNPTSPYYAWEGGAVTPAGNILASSYVGKALEYFDKPNVGQALTGALDLPISDMQYAWPDPNNTGGSVLVAQTGDPTQGYPIFRVSFTSAYEIPSGWFKGLGLVIGGNNAWDWRTYIYNTPTLGVRPMFSQAELGWQIDLHPYYRRKFGRYWFRTQLDIQNLTNHYIIQLAPNNGSGFTVPSSVSVMWNGQPRYLAWSNTLGF